MAYLTGQLVGSFLAMGALSLLIYRLLTRRLIEDEMNRAFVTAGAAYLIGSVIYGFASANGGAFRLIGFAHYFPGALASGALLIKYGKEREYD